MLKCQIWFVQVFESSNFWVFKFFAFKIGQNFGFLVFQVQNFVFKCFKFKMLSFIFKIGQNFYVKMSNLVCSGV